MSVAVQLEPAANVPAVEYRWDADTDILTARLRGANGRTGMSGSVEVEGSDGSWLILDVASGCIDGVEVAVWPDVHKRRGLAPPASWCRTSSSRWRSARKARTPAWRRV